VGRQVGEPPHPLVFTDESLSFQPRQHIGDPHDAKMRDGLAKLQIPGDDLGDVGDERAEWIQVQVRGGIIRPEHSPRTGRAPVLCLERTCHLAAELDMIPDRIVSLVAVLRSTRRFFFCVGGKRVGLSGCKLQAPRLHCVCKPLTEHFYRSKRLSIRAVLDQVLA
jgi:hypothetical protein